MKESKVDVFMEMAESIASLSPDSQTKVGSIAINPDTYEALLPSFNGYVSGSERDLPTTRPEKYEYILHAEVNMVCQAARSGRSLEGYWSIQTLSPCSNCMRTLWQSGIKTIVFRDYYGDFQKQLQMEDLDIELSKLGKYTRIDLSIKRS